MKDMYGLEIEKYTKYYVTNNNEILSFFSINRYVIEELNEGYSHLTLFELIQCLLKQNKIKEKELI